MEWRPQDRYLAVPRHAYTFVFSLNPNFFRAHRQEILLLSQAAKQCAPCQPDQPQPSSSVRDVEAELAGIETGAATNIKSLHLIFVVADEDKRCATRQSFSVNVQMNVEKRITAQHRNGGPDVRRPLTPAQPLLLRALANDAWIQAEAGIVDEDVVVNLAKINFYDVTFDDGLNGGLKLERNMQVLGEMIHCPQRQNAERFFCIEKL